MPHRRSLLFIGPFPTPVTGQTVSTEVLAHALQERGVRLVKRNIVRGDSDSTFHRLAVRMVRIVLAMISIVGSFRRRSIYISVDANKGMWITVMLASLARVFGKSTVLHYHSYSHLSQPNKIAKCLINVAGPNTDHMHICPFMSDRAAKLYPNIRIRSSLSNAHVIDLPNDREGTADSKLGLEASDSGELAFRIGFLGRLSREKGAKLALDVYRELRQRGRNVRLVLAGPRTADQSFLEEGVESEKSYSTPGLELPGMLGPSEKHQFYKSIDGFLFPTQYKNETQGIVNIEAMAYGVPVIAYGRCCVKSDVGNKGGVVIDPADDYVSQAVQTLEQWIDDWSNHQNRKQEAAERFQALRNQSHEEIDLLISRHKLFSKPLVDHESASGALDV